MPRNLGKTAQIGPDQPRLETPGTPQTPEFAVKVTHKPASSAGNGWYEFAERLAAKVDK